MMTMESIESGSKSAADALVPAVYAELRRLAGSYLRGERPSHTLQPTALVHEAYARLASGGLGEYNDRGHFLAIAAQAMRQILVDHARKRNANKRGGGAMNITLTDRLEAIGRAPELIALDDALTALEQKDPRKGRLIEMRYFGGLSAEEIGEIFGISAASVRRELRIAQAWLQRRMDTQK